MKKRGKTRVFWQELVETEEIKIKIEEHQLAGQEKEYLLNIVHQTLHLEIIDTILSHLPKEKQPVFLDKFSDQPDDPGILAVVKEEVADIEEKISLAVKRVKEKIIAELAEL